MTTDLRVDDRVYLMPKTKAPPAICYKQLPAVVIANTRGPMVTVLIDGEDATREIHIRNLTRTAPQPRQAHLPVLPAIRKLALPEGVEEAPLW